MCFRPDAGSDDNGIEMNELAVTSSLLPQVTTATNDSKEHGDNATNPTTSDQERPTNTSNTITVDPSQHSNDQDDNNANAKKETSCCSDLLCSACRYMKTMCTCRFLSKICF